MTERTTILHEVGWAFRDNGLTAAITALIGGFIAHLAAATCPPIVDYRPVEQTRAADEVNTLLEDAMIVRMLSDYAVLRDQARACR